MTCIVAVNDIKNKRIIFGSDTQITCHSVKSTLKMDKFFEKEDFIFAVAGGCQLDNDIRYCFDIPSHPTDMDNETYIFSIFREKFLNFIRDEQYFDSEGDFPYQIMFSYRDDIYEVTPDQCIFRLNFHYNAVGSGSPFALGSLYSSFKNSPNRDCKNALKLAIETAGTFEEGCNTEIEYMIKEYEN